jgi:esterase
LWICKYDITDVCARTHQNLRTPAKKLTERIPHLSALCLDIRGHGNSTSRWSSPHTIQSCAIDVQNTLIPLGLTGDRSPTAFCGHSLGGRIALQYSSGLAGGLDGASSIRPPKHTWILDSVPGQPDPSVHNVLNAISSIPLPISSKNDVTTLLMEKHGFNKAIAMWIASNLQQRDGGLEWVFDLQIANELVSNFAQQEYHQSIENVINCNKSEKLIHLVMAGRNKEWTEEIVDGLRSIPGASEERFRMHRLEKAGHWIHVDDLEGLLDVMVEGLKDHVQ